jgi:hypothetical protein
MVYRTIEVTTKRQFREFIRLPYRIYAGNTCWVPPIESEVKRILNPAKNPYFLNAGLRLFSTYREDIIVARCAVIINRMHQQKFRIKNAFFGFFESINSDEAVKSLFTEAESFCRRRGVEFLEGPFNPNLYSDLGLLTNKFDSTPSFFQTYNPPYYQHLLEEAGFNVLKKLNIRSNKKLKDFLMEHYTNNLCTESKNMRIRSFNIKRKEEDLDYLREIYNDAFSGNWHFIPVSKEEYIFSAKYLHLVTPPDLIKFVEYKGTPVGVIQFALDINPFLKTFKGKFRPLKYLNLIRNKKRIRRAIVFAVGIKKAFQRTIAHQLLLNAAVLLARNYDELETSWMYDDNLLAVKAAERFGMQPEKYYSILGKSLVPKPESYLSASGLIVSESI